jgi:hypothetical protein
MAELAGKSCVIKISGTSTAMTGEATTSADNKNYQITSTTKRVLDMTATISILKKGTDDEAEAGTNTTTLIMSTHGLATGDVIINTTRSNAKRAVTWVDANTVTVTAVTDQQSGDTIQVYKADTGYASLNRLNGTVTYTDALSRTILISGYYLPMSTAAYANSASRVRTADLLDIEAFGDTNKKRLKGLLHASGTLTQIDVTDDTYTDALTAGVPVVLEELDAAASEPNRVWIMLESSEIQAAVDGIESNVVSWVSHDEWLTLGG